MAAWLNRETQLCAAILPDRIIGDWSLPLLARQVVKLGIVDSISREIVGRRLRFSAPGTRPPQWYTD